MKIIGVAGRKGSGKDTFAYPLLCAGWLQLRFADGLKNMLRALLTTAGVEGQLIENYIEFDRDTPIAALCGKTMRHAMQTLGTEWGRDLISGDLWLRVMLERLKSCALNGTTKVIITDVRFPNECDFLRACGGYVVRVNRSSISKTDSHPSEAQIDELRADIDVLNDQEIGTLHAMALRIADTTGHSNF